MENQLPTEEKYKEGSLMRWFFTGWVLSSSELQKEVEGYDKLKWSGSSRKLAAAAWGIYMAFSLIVGLARYFMGNTGSLDLVLGSIMYLVLVTPLIYMGYQLALVTAAFLLLWEAGNSIISARFFISLASYGPSFLFGFLFTLSFIVFILKTLYTAFIVEQARSSLRKTHGTRERSESINQ